MASNAGALVRGTLLGLVTDTKKYVKSASGASDGSQVPNAILAEAVATSAGVEAAATAYLSGEFNENAITLGTGHTLDSVREGLRDKNIYLKKAKEV